MAWVMAFASGTMRRRPAYHAGEDTQNPKASVPASTGADGDSPDLRELRRNRGRAQAGQDVELRGEVGGAGSMGASRGTQVR